MNPPNQSLREVSNLREPEIRWDWDKAEYIPAWHEPIFLIMSRFIPAGARVLEVGAGGSHTIGALASRLECNAYGLEPDSDGIKTTLRFAGDQAAEIRLVRGDGFCLPFADSQFDVVYSLGLIEHFEPEESASLVAEHVRVCRPGGHVIISVPNLLNLPHTLRKLIRGKNYEYFPERSYIPGKLRATLISAGLRIVAMDGLLPLWGITMMPHGWRVTALLDRLNLSRWMESPKLRAKFGYMIFAVGVKP